MNLKDNYSGALQQPLHSGFNATSTVHDVIKGIDLTGKTAIVTGGYAGIGLETVKTFVAAGAKVTVPARDIHKAANNLKGINNVTIETMDLMDPASIDAFAEKFLTTNDTLDILVNNAGIMWVPLQRDKRGYESQLSTNHLGHFQLTAKLWPALKKARGARVVNVSSYGHQMAPFDFEDPNFTNRVYETLQGYGQSKTANNLFAVELDHRGKAFGVRAFSVHPGSVNGTDLGRVAPMALFQQMGTHDEAGNIRPEVAAKLKSIEQGAATQVWCATTPQLNDLGGVYCEDADVAVLDEGNIAHNYNEPSSLRGVQPYSVDAENARKLWALTEKLTGVAFPVN
ncbi:NAD(P)-dependent dehydrogenase, short-chain alcohol dehydrogenase family [Chitinophaga ginsengisegetis]|uniref:NAD(P)-dependent dehydrogenase, short-chain alcohol dehydrogenase family n=1 Tax=Chitinophaga ginsengisegetis TaxID=393003 RepID=A0A1T5PAN4_9BACT|nr:SDR family NAD(P)-dependent oxidoreductase [Chitinophaga ginsengisegetis]SKD09761.1 NAD(P)-dependent dehydrogenase, short-chain alcohol dehydrogenase family [Chitinophaga ginsengisegetis]